MTTEEKFLKDNKLELKDIQGYRVVKTPTGYQGQLSIRTGGFIDIPNAFGTTSDAAEGISGQFLFGTKDTTPDHFNPTAKTDNYHDGKFGDQSDRSFEVSSTLSHNDHAAAEGIVHGAPEPGGDVDA